MFIFLLNENKLCLHDVIHNIQNKYQVINPMWMYYGELINTYNIYTSIYV